MSKTEKTRIVKPKTKLGSRILKQREPQQVELVRKILLLYGTRSSQVVKDLLSDIHSLYRTQTVKYTRKNDILPFENGGEVELERFSAKTDCGQFVLASHTKKRPHNLILGRFYDHRLYDLLELGVENYKPLKDFRGASSLVQINSKPCFVFAGEQFEHEPEFQQAKSMLLDLFRGSVVDGFNLMGMDHVIFVTARERTLLFRQYAIRLKRSGTKVPRIELSEMGPRMDLTLRRVRAADSSTAKEAHTQPKLTKKKEKNISSSLLDGRVGRIYMPKQQIAAMPQHKIKGLKRSLDTEEGEAGNKKSKPAQIEHASDGDE